ncbi:MAG: hypothetical protein ACJ8BW_14175 [Ktedonobacteraceae bacterium]
MADLDCSRVGIPGYGVGKLYVASLLNIGVYYPNLPAMELVA